MKNRNSDFVHFGMIQSEYQSIKCSRVFYIWSACFSASVRLALRWLSAQMLSDLVPDIAAELLMAQVRSGVSFVFIPDSLGD